MQRQTLDDIRAIPKGTLAPKDIAGYLGCDPYSITLQAREDSRSFPFPVLVTGTRTRIPKEGFLRWAEGVREGTA